MSQNWSLLSHQKDWLIDQKITCLFLVIALCYICYVASHHYSLHSMKSQCDTICV